MPLPPKFKPGKNPAAQSVALPRERHVLTVAEVAAHWRVTPLHITNLIESGQLGAVDVAGRLDSVLVPKTALNQLAPRLKVTPEQLFEFISTIKPDGKQKKRSLWRVPMESFATFNEKRNSLNSPTK